MALIEKIGEKRAGGLLENSREPKAQKINSDSYPYVNTGSEAVDFSASRRGGVASAQEAKSSVMPLTKSDEKDKSPAGKERRMQYRSQGEYSESHNKFFTPSNASGESGSLNFTNSDSNSSDYTNSGNSLSDEAGVANGVATNLGPVKLITPEEVKKLRENLEKVIDLFQSWRMDDKLPTPIQDKQFKVSSRPLSPQGEQSRSSRPLSPQGEQSESPRLSEGSKVDLSDFFNTLNVVSSPSSTGSLDPSPTTGSPVNSQVEQVPGINSSRSK